MAAVIAGVSFGAAMGLLLTFFVTGSTAWHIALGLV